MGKGEEEVSPEVKPEWMEGKEKNGRGGGISESLSRKVQEFLMTVREAWRLFI